MTGSPGPVEHGGLHGLRPDHLQPGELVLDHWSAPGGLGLLTNFRCFLLGHPQPIHRPILWVTDLRAIRTVSVEFIPGFGVSGVSLRIDGRGGSANAATDTTQAVGIPAKFRLLIDGVVMAEGGADRCNQIEQRIEEATRSLGVAGPTESGA